VWGIGVIMGVCWVVTKSVGIAAAAAAGMD